MSSVRPRPYGATVRGFQAVKAAPVLRRALPAWELQARRQKWPAGLLQQLEVMVIEAERAAAEYLADGAEIAAGGNAAVVSVAVPSSLRHVDELTTQQAADRLRVKPRRIRQLLKDGSLTGRQLRPGGPHLVDRESVDDLVEARRSA